MNASEPTPDQSRWWKNSFFSLPKNPSHAALSGLHPFADMLLTSPFSSQILIHSGHL